MKLTCIMCPMGCNIEVNEVNGEKTYAGYGCNRGIKYAAQETTKPERVVTSLAVTDDGEVFSCKTDGSVEKNLIFDVLKEIKKVKYPKPIKMNAVLIENVLNTGVNIISTMEKN